MVVVSPYLQQQRREVPALLFLLYHLICVAATLFAMDVQTSVHELTWRQERCRTTRG